MPSDPLDVLDALDAEASPGPWYDGHVGGGDRDPLAPTIASEARGWLADLRVDLCDECVCGGCGCDDDDGCPELLSLEETRANARLAVTLRTVLPELRAVVRAAEGRDEDGCSEQCRVMQPYRGCTCGGEELRRALDALRARLAEVNNG